MSQDPQEFVKSQDDAATPALSARGIRKSYAVPGGRLEVLRGLDLEVPRGMLLAIVGASGTGKSTLLNVLGTLDQPDEGSLELGGEKLAGLNETQRCRLRMRLLGFVFQFHHLLPEFTAEENVMMPLLVAGESFERSRVRAREPVSYTHLTLPTNREV